MLEIILVGKSVHEHQLKLQWINWSVGHQWESENMKHIHTCIGDQIENEWTTCSFKELNLNRYHWWLWFCLVLFCKISSRNQGQGCRCALIMVLWYVAFHYIMKNIVLWYVFQHQYHICKESQALNINIYLV